MAEVEMTINGRGYRVACENGQESRLSQLGQYFDRQVTRLAGDLGQIGESRLMLLAALTMCDELFETRRRLAELERAAQPLDATTEGAASRIVMAAAERVAGLATRAGDG